MTHTRPNMENHEPLFLLKSTSFGSGLFAQTAISAGQRIIKEKPIISISRQEAQTQSEHDCVVAKAHQLDDFDKQTFMGLYHNPQKLEEFMFLRHQPKPPHLSIDPCLVLAKFYTNAASLSTGGLQCGLFVTFCRMNHSCTPNTCWVYDENTGTMEVYAVKDIPEGEEITDSYTDVARTRDLRAKELSNWGFVCACSACDGPNAREHDARRRRITQIRELLEIYRDHKSQDRPKFAELPKSDAEALDLAMESVELLLAEELVEELGVAYGWCSGFARSLGRIDDAKLYEEKEFDILVMTTGTLADED